MQNIKARHSLKSGRKIIGHQPDVSAWGPRTIPAATVDMPQGIQLCDEFQWRPYTHASEVGTEIALSGAFPGWDRI